MSSVMYLKCRKSNRLNKVLGRLKKIHLEDKHDGTQWQQMDLCLMTSLANYGQYKASSDQSVLMRVYSVMVE